MNWTKISENHFHLSQRETVVASMTRQQDYFECRIGGRLRYLRRKGFWGNQLQLTDEQGQVLAWLKPASLTGASYRFRLCGREYRLVVRNNPLAEYVIREDGRDLVAYGLKTGNGRVAAVITDHRREKLYELDLLLWCLFHPVAQAETGDAAIDGLLLLTA